MSRFEKNFCTGRMYAAFARRLIMPWALDGFHPTGEVLEIGSGGGAIAAQLLLEFPDLRIIATDYDPELVAVTARSLKPFGQRATVNRADAAALPFAADRFDVVLSFAMFHHVPDWERAEAPDQEVRPHHALALDVYLAPAFELVSRNQAAIRFLRYLDPSRDTARLHPAGGVDGIAPDVVRESVTPDHGCHRWAAIDTDPEADRPSA